jgi:hypothetical protein
MTTKVRYIGSETPYFPPIATGVRDTWRPGVAMEVTQQQATALLATGVFEIDQPGDQTSPVSPQWIVDVAGNPIGLRGPRGEVLGGAIDVRAFGAIGDGVADDTAAIQAALNSGAAALDFGSLTYRVSGWAIVASEVTLSSSGATFIQDLWGYPAFEIRSQNVKMLGLWVFRYDGDRTAVINTNTLGYAYVHFGNWKDYGSAIYMNALNGYSVDGFHADHVKVFGFINGIWLNGSDVSVGVLECDTTDMGASGGGGHNQRIGKIVHKNITGTQGVEGHALYQVSAAPSDGMYIGAIVVDGSPTGASAVKLHNYKNFVIDSISGSDMGAIAYFRDGATGVVGKIAVSLNQSLYSGITYGVLAFGAGTKVVIGTAVIETSQTAAQMTAVFQATSGELVVQKLVLAGTTTADAQPRVALVTSSGSLEMASPVIAFESSICTNPAFDLGSYNKAIIHTPYYKTGGTNPWLLRNTYSAGQRYALTLNPNLVPDGLKEGSITCTANISFFVDFVCDSQTPIEITGGFPVVTHANVARITQGGATDLRQLRRATAGHRIFLVNGDGNSNLFHNGNAGQDGNILTTTGATIGRALWTYAWFKRVGTDMVMLGYI